MPGKGLLWARVSKPAPGRGNGDRKTITEYFAQMWRYQVLKNGKHKNPSVSNVVRPGTRRPVNVPFGSHSLFAAKTVLRDHGDR